MNAKKIIQPQNAPAPVGPYSHAVRAGDFLFCSGQIPLDPSKPAQILNEMTVAAQTEQVMRNIHNLLEHEHLTWASVVKTTVFMTNLADFAVMNEAYGHFFQKDPPARSTVQVAALPKGAKVEIEAVAFYGN
jgi:2-iminobutanoate/2-iminopropanoate deaminase